MGDSIPSIPESDGGHLVAAAQQIVKALGSKKTLTDGERKALTELSSKFSTFNSLSSNEDKFEGIGGTEKRLKSIQERVMSRVEDQSMIWDSGPEEASQYLEAVAETQQLIGKLSLSKEEKTLELLARAYDILRASMARLEKEFKHILIQNSVPFKPDHMSFRSNEEDSASRMSIASFEDESLDETPHKESISKDSPEFIIELVRPDVIPDIKGIAKLMFVSKYEQECSQAFICVRENALDDCLRILEIEKLNHEDVKRIEWKSLSPKMKRWVWAMKLFVQVYLAREKWLHDQVFGELDHSISFVKASEASLMHLLKFGKAVADSRREPEKLLGVLDMYEVLEGLIPEIKALYLDKAGSSVRTECNAVLNSLGSCIRDTFLEYENAISSNRSVIPSAESGVQKLTRYVMNHIKTLIDYSATLNLLLFDDATKYPPSSVVPPMTQHFLSLISTLESNLEHKSKLCKDEALQHFFLMNNVRYMAELAKNSELGSVLGDEWVRNHNLKVKKHAVMYDAATWNSILALVMEDGLQDSKPHSRNLEKLLKGRLGSFYSEFEEIYKTQTGWYIRDPQLREDTQTLICSKVVNAYRAFVKRHANDIKEKYIKYSPEELLSYVLDLFEESQRSLPSSHRWR